MRKWASASGQGCQELPSLVSTSAECGGERGSWWDPVYSIPLYCCDICEVFCTVGMNPFWMRFYLLFSESAFKFPCSASTPTLRCCTPHDLHVSVRLSP